MRKTKIDIARRPITFMTCDERWEIFAPTWDLIHAYKDGSISWTEYVEKYTDEMRSAYRDNSDLFVQMAKRLDNVEFYCWCNNMNKQDEKCHRFLLRNILNKVKEHLGANKL